MTVHRNKVRILLIVFFQIIIINVLLRSKLNLTLLYVKKLSHYFLWKKFFNGNINSYQAVPLIWVLMEKKTKDAYECVYTFFKEVTNNGKVPSIMSEFESIIGEGAAWVYPAAYTFCRMSTVCIRIMKLSKMMLM